MELEVMFNSGEEKGEEYAMPNMPAGLDDSVSMVLQPSCRRPRARVT